MHDPMTQVGEFPPFAFRSWWNERTGKWLPALVELWHEDPSGYDTDECGSHDLWHPRHFQHWKIRVCAAQRLRKHLFQRCAGCGGWSTKRNPVDHSHGGWDAPGALHWWWSIPNVYHDECSRRQSGLVRQMVDNQRREGRQQVSRAVLAWSRRFQPGDRWDPQDFADLAAWVAAPSTDTREADDE